MKFSFPIGHQTVAPERGADWQDLVSHVASQRDGNEDTLAFSLMMIRLCDCLNCDQSSYKASLGCVTCAQRVVSAQKGSDLKLRQTFERTRQEIRQRLIPAQLTAATRIRWPRNPSAPRGALRICPSKLQRREPHSSRPSRLLL